MWGMLVTVLAARGVMNVNNRVVAQASTCDHVDASTDQATKDQIAYEHGVGCGGDMGHAFRKIRALAADGQAVMVFLDHDGRWAGKRPTAFGVERHAGGGDGLSATVGGDPHLLGVSLEHAGAAAEQ